MKIEKRKMLFITSRFSFPPIGGDKLRSYNLLLLLSKHFSVHVVVITDEKANPEIIAFYKSHSEKLTIFFKPKWMFYLNALRSLFNALPLQVNYYYFNDVQVFINEESKTTQILFPVLIRTAKYVENINLFKYLEMTDSIALNYVKSINNVTSLFWKAIYKFEKSRLLNYEKKVFNSFNGVILVNRNEKNHWKHHGNVICIPNGVADNLFTKYNSQPKKDLIGFFGKMDYQPNIDAVNWFVNNCFKYLPPNFKFIIIGSNPKKAITKLTTKYKNIIVTGYIDDPYSELLKCNIIVAPMQTGGGIQNKILESLALGKIVLSTSKAVESIEGLKSGHNIFEANSPGEYLELINHIYKFPHRFKHIGNNAKALMKRKYRWNKFGKQLVKILDN